MTSYAITDGRHECGCTELGSLEPGGVIEVCSLERCGRVAEMHVILGLPYRPAKRARWWRR